MVNNNKFSKAIATNHGSHDHSLVWYQPLNSNNKQF